MTAPEVYPLLPGYLTDPSKPLTFGFEGRTIRAVEGQSVAAALYAAGVRVFSRSFKYHRPRGLFCVSGDCPNCLMQVDGRPNVRTCIEPARQGMNVRGQNAWPSLGFDLLRVFDRLSYFLPVGFYYKRFHKPRWAWPLFERVVRHIAGLGRIDIQARPEGHAEVEHLHADVCVIGAGPAGLAAGEAAAAAGADVLLLEREARCGGHLLYEGKADTNAELSAGMRVLLETTAFGLYEGNLVGAFQKGRLLKVRAGQVIVCTGARQRPLLFRNNDLPGIFLGRGILRLARLHGVSPGRRAMVVTNHNEGHRLARQLRALGIDVAAVADSRPEVRGGEGGFPVLAGHVAVRARGWSRLRAVEIARVSDTGVIETASRRVFACDLLCLAPRLVPANELLYQGGMRFTYEGGRWVPSQAVPGLLAAGAAAGTFELEAQIREGRLRGREAAARCGLRVEELGGDDAEVRPTPALTNPQSAIRNLQSKGKCFVCLCEDVTTKDLGQAVAEGFDHIETLKRYATVGMGPCQGKMCGQTSTEVCASLTGREVSAVGTTTSRPPVVPVELAVLAAERQHQPVRRTPLHHWHAAHGARWMDAGQWKRPESYGSPEEEVRAVRTRVGLIDVSTLGKIEVFGPDAAELLERIYLGEWANLAVGRARYGLMCTEEGIVFDDGIGARLGPEHFYLTATTGNAEAVFQWLELWRTTWKLDATVINRTPALAALNVAGPRARDVMRQLTTLDLSSAAFPYPAVREAEVAGVPCRLLRVGFVGEVGYEIHGPSAYGLHLWEALMAAGAEFGLRPFGVEAQRILRLEKGHVIIGQDTDALSNPFGAGFGRMIRFMKPRFHGRETLLRFKELPARTRLVGFHIPAGAPQPRDNAWARRLEGCQVVEQGRPVGRVTSARFSPTLEKYIGLAWVPEARAVAGGEFRIRCDGADLAARVHPPPFYDPQGERLKG
jgi:sarcosine oxidase subunit alpha